MTDDLHLQVREIAETAGRVLLSLRKDLSANGIDPKELKDRGDQASQEVLAAELTRRYPRDAVLSEEAADDSRRLEADRVWIIDPLDGTREFSEVPRDDWAVHVALWRRGELVAGAVTLPARGVSHTTEPGSASLPSRPAGAPFRLAVSRSRPPAFVTALADRLGAELVPMGSAGVKAMSVLDGTTDAYVHAGGQYEWDSAAPVAVARAHGLHTSRIDGTELVYNNPSPWMPDLLVCRPEVAEELLSALQEMSTGAE
ncbi:3'(2'),5'-bisphosphate nucleotidase CysQ [Ornithinicoccus halotolerans]|uniref:3'(2'),5'-bisphosphate nucleotidase CysQ n=1 Tax=Ornithinicoccus halotolerans TaxID=1748220 RepID=UPI001E56F9BC|nr:3'(2'),5'-bisphosphate nucleotidase CysQ [Ornithinicoccus halotolerans]